MQKQLLFAFIFFAFISLLLYFFHTFPLISSLEGFVQGAFSTPKKILYLAKPRASQSPLQEENRKLSEKLVEFEKLKTENAALRSQFDAAEGAAFSTQNLLPANIIGFIGEINNPNTLIIDKGKESGVLKGAAVIYQKHLVGKVSSVSARASQVILANNPLFSTVAKTIEQNASGVAGGAGDFILLSHVAIKETIDRGNIVVTKGDRDEKGAGILPNLILGKVQSVQKQETKPFQNAQVKPMIDYSKLTTVFVEKRL